MISYKHFLSISLLIILVLTLTQTTQAKSVYVINDTITSQLQAYKIEDSNLVWQADYVCKTEPTGGMGAVGLAIDESQYGQFLFVTFEGTNKIELVNAKTMISEQNPVTVTGVTNLAGIAFDQGSEKLYKIGDIFV